MSLLSAAHAQTFFITRRCARAVLAMTLCPSVCLSHAGIVSKRLNGSSLFLANRLPRQCLDVSYIALEGNSDIFKNKDGYFSLELCPKLWT